MKIRRFANWIRIAALCYLAISFVNTFILWGEMIEVEYAMGFHRQILFFVHQLVWDILHTLLIFGGAWVLESIAGIREQATQFLASSGKDGNP